MKKFAILLIAIAACFGARAQKFALVDMEYILKNIPQYEVANNQLEELSQRWQKEVEAISSEAQTMYKSFVEEKAMLTPKQTKAREDEIVAKEKAAAELRYKYFGPDGDLAMIRQKLLQPVQDQVYNAIKKIATDKGFQAIFDRASSTEIIFASPRIDISDEVLLILGYSK